MKGIIGITVAVTLVLGVLLAVVVGLQAIMKTKPEVKEGITKMLSIVKEDIAEILSTLRATPVLGSIIEAILFIREVLYRHSIEFVTAFIMGIARKNPIVAYTVSIILSLFVRWGKLDIPLHVFVLESSIVWLVMYLLGFIARHIR